MDMTEMSFAASIVLKKQNIVPDLNIYELMRKFRCPSNNYIKPNKLNVIFPCL